MPDYNNTLNLPKTDFPMRAGLTEKEPALLDLWESKKIYQKVMEKNNGKQKYVLHDGPPYANGNIHMGHALNKILKDIIVRYKNMSGFKAPFVPGWDTHGLPTELKVRAKVGVEKSKNLTDIELRKMCKDFALSYVDTQRDQFKRLGILADWDNPYITLKPEFEKKQLEIFAKMVEHGSIYRGLKPVYWCSDCETALAEAEIEYSNDECKSIYVKFRVSDDNGKLHSKGIDCKNTYFVIWTTTAWTLPGNMAVCLGGDFDYSVVKSGSNFYIIASNLVGESMEAAGLDDYSICGKFKGCDLEHIKLEHPFLERESLVILGEHVTLESGTGCVHTAPGHGVEDFDVCQKYDELKDIIVPVDSRGIFTDDAGEFKGLNINDGGKKIIEKLKSNGMLFAIRDINHQYPHCWRCKNPVLFRATKQWFCSIDKFKDKAINETEKVTWIPNWGKDRISAMISERKDWCISRQRKWGVPIPVFFCDKCGEPLMDPKVINMVAEIFGKEGSDAWFLRDVKYFLPNGYKCKNCGGLEFSKETDIMDVWFDSGVTHTAVCKEIDDLNWPADLYLEGADQYRGWFQSSLITSVAAFGEAPYKAVATHGWVVDDEGKKQSKSQGNGVDPCDVIDKYGADILRLWAASADYHSDVRISHDILKQLSESYRKIRNTARYIIGNLYDFTPDENSVDLSEIYEIDKWAIYKLDELIDTVRKSYETLEFHNVYHSIHKFCIVDMSNFYLDVLKERLYVYGKNSKERRSAQTCMYIILNALVKLLAPVLPFTTEEIWKYLPKLKTQNIENIILSDMPEKNNITLDSSFIEKWDYIHKIKNDLRKALEDARKNKVIGSSLDAKVCIFCQGEDNKMLKGIVDTLKSVLIVSEVEIFDSGSGDTALENLEKITVSVSRAEGNKCDRCWSYSKTVGKNKENPDLCDRCLKVLSKD